MSTTTFDGDRIGPKLDLADLALPPHVGARLATVTGSDGRIETGAAWVDAMQATVDPDVDGQVTESDLCHAADGAHTVRLGDETASFVCVIDPLMVPFLRQTPGTVTSQAPVAGETVEISVGPDDATASPPEAILSLGVARDPVDATPSAEHLYDAVCPYVHAFTTVAEYEEWAATVDAATTSLPVATGVALARELAHALVDTVDETE